MARVKRTARPARAPEVPRQAESYQHPESTSPMRPEVGTQAQFRKRKPPATYRYDSSLSPALDWDGQNSARERGERELSVLSSQLAEIRRIVAQGSPSNPAALPALKKDNDVEKPQDRIAGPAVQRHLSKAEEAVQNLKALSKPFLNWAGKAERLSFDVPTLPLFVHERLSTYGILETLKGHRRDKQQTMFELFGDPQHSVTDQVLRAYEHRDQWVNRMVLGDSLVVMNSLLHYEGLGGQVQMIYMDPPYGVKFGSNFQPFVRKRDVSHNDDEDMTREPEMVQAYRDTWELGLHSYLTYMRDRLLLARDLLSPSGSIFVQISDENLHYVRELMGEVFGNEHYCGLIAFRTTGGQSTALISVSTDYLIWYAKDKERAKEKYKNPTAAKAGGTDASGQYSWIEPRDFSQLPRRMTADELSDPELIPQGWRMLRPDNLYGQGAPSDPDDYDFHFQSRTFSCPQNNHWKTGVKSGGMQKLADSNRLMVVGNTLSYKRYVEDFPVYLLDNVWNDTAISGFARKKEYVVETSSKVAERCVLMTTDPGDLVLDPTCGSGTTAYVAERWGRRWITIDTSRVPLALARQRLLTATFPWYELKDEKRGPAGGFDYQRKQNKKGEEVGGIVPHVTLKSIANNEPPEEEVLVDRPEKDDHITRVSGAFCVEATIPTPVGILEEDQKGVEATTPTRAGAHSGLQMTDSGSRIGADSKAQTADSGRGQTDFTAGADSGFQMTDSGWRAGAGGDSKSQMADSGSKSQIADSGEDGTNFTDRMLEILRKSPLLRLAGNSTVTLRNIRPPAKTLSLSAEALVDATAPGQKASLADAVQEAAEKSGQALALSAKPVALVFGPENGAVSERLVQEAAREAYLKSYTHLYVIGFAIQPHARQLVENCEAVIGIPATYVQATPDLMMGHLLKNMRSSQIFSVCGLPEIKILRVGKGDAAGGPKPSAGAESQITDSGFQSAKHVDSGFQSPQYQVELLGLDVFDPITMENVHRNGDDVPAWFLDTDYNGLCFHVTQAFFPRTGAWENLKKALKGEYEESVWDHLAGTLSAPFEAGEQRQIAVKVIDDRGNELMVVEKLGQG